jgi:hypothetical protein
MTLDMMSESFFLSRYRSQLYSIPTEFLSYCACACACACAERAHARENASERACGRMLVCVNVCYQHGNEQNAKKHRRATREHAGGGEGAMGHAGGGDRARRKSNGMRTSSIVPRA